jgi:hypothetical protein
VAYFAVVAFFVVVVPLFTTLLAPVAVFLAAVLAAGFLATAFLATGFVGAI